MTARIRRADAIAVANAIPYDPECPVCIEMEEGPHPDECAMRAVRRILDASE